MFLFLSCDKNKDEILPKINSIDCLLYNESCDFSNPNPITFCNYGFHLSFKNNSKVKVKYKILEKLDYLVLNNNDILVFNYFKIDKKKTVFFEYKNKYFEVDSGKDVSINFQDINISFNDFKLFDSYLNKLKLEDGATFYLNSLEINGKLGYVIKVKKKIVRRYFIDDKITSSKTKIKTCPTESFPVVIPR